MPDYRATLPKFTWGAAFANTMNIGYPVDNWGTYADPRDGFLTVRSPAGIRDVWDTADDYFLALDLGYIPASGTASPLATGWDGLTGGRAFLSWARRNPIRFYPDASSGFYWDCELVEPMSGAPALEEDGTRRLKVVLRHADATKPFEGY